MSSHEPNELHLSSLLRLFVPFLDSNVINALGVLWQLARKIISRKAHEGMYEALEYDSRLELQDAKGEKSVLHKREKVRILQENIIAYQDQAWGDGDLF